MTPTIVHVASGREWRGGQRQTWLLARELARLGVDQVVVTGADSELARRLVADGVRVRGVRWRSALDPRALFAVRAELRRTAILHAHDPHALTIAGVARFGQHTPLVVTRRVIFPLRRPGFWVRADRVIAISSAVEAALVADGVSANRIDMIPSGVDLGDMGPTESAKLRARLDLPPGTPIALSIAALTPEKDHVTLLEAAALARRTLPSLHWVVAGDGPLRDELRQRIEQLGLQRSVSLLGFVDDPEHLLADASLFVLGSTSEGLGSSVLAAWARGVPVVATRVGGLAELLRDGAGLLVPPRDPAALAEAAARVATDASLHADLSRRGHAAVREYDARGMAERVRTVYRSCS